MIVFMIFLIHYLVQKILEKKNHFLQFLLIPSFFQSQQYVLCRHFHQLKLFPLHHSTAKTLYLFYLKVPFKARKAQIQFRDTQNPNTLKRLRKSPFHPHLPRRQETFSSAFVKQTKNKVFALKS